VATGNTTAGKPAQLAQSMYRIRAESATTSSSPVAALAATGGGKQPRAGVSTTSTDRKVAAAAATTAVRMRSPRATSAGVNSAAMAILLRASGPIHAAPPAARTPAAANPARMSAVMAAACATRTSSK